MKASKAATTWAYRTPNPLAQELLWILSHDSEIAEYKSRNEWSCVPELISPPFQYVISVALGPLGLALLNRGVTVQTAKLTLQLGRAWSLRCRPDGRCASARRRVDDVRAVVERRDGPEVPLDPGVPACQLYTPVVRQDWNSD